MSFDLALTHAIDMANAAYERDGHLSGLATVSMISTTRWAACSRPTDHPRRPSSMGKTALVTNIAYHVAKRFRSERLPDGSEKTVEGGRVGFFSLEMSAEQLATRILSEQPRSRPRRSAAADLGRTSSASSWPSRRR